MQMRLRISSAERQTALDSIEARYGAGANVHMGFEFGVVIKEFAKDITREEMKELLIRVKANTAPRRNTSLRITQKSYDTLKNLAFENQTTMQAIYSAIMLWREKQLSTTAKAETEKAAEESTEVEVKENEDDKAEHVKLRALSWNLHGIMGAAADYVVPCRLILDTLCKLNKPDVVCFQEFESTAPAASELVMNMERLGYKTQIGAYQPRRNGIMVAVHETLACSANFSLSLDGEDAPEFAGTLMELENGTKVLVAAARIQSASECAGSRKPNGRQVERLLQALDNYSKKGYGIVCGVDLNVDRNYTYRFPTEHCRIVTPSTGHSYIGGSKERPFPLALDHLIASGIKVNSCSYNDSHRVSHAKLYKYRTTESYISDLPLPDHSILLAEIEI